MAKRRKPLNDWLVYVVVRAIICALQCMPLAFARRCASGLAWLVFHLDKRHRQVARDNLLHAFPHLAHNPAGLERLILKVITHFCTLIVEIVHLPRMMHVRSWRKYLSLDDNNRVVKALLSNRPLMIVTGHLGNWEMAGYSLGALGFETHAIARVLDNPFLEKYLRSFRERTGQKVLAKKGDFDQMQEILARGGTIATLADQDAGPRGQFVDFFGRPASTHKAIALMALEFQVPMAVVGVPRVGLNLKYKVECEDIIYPEEYANRPDAVRAITQRFTSALERIIRRYPEQYFWLHRRWKHQPVERKAKSRAA